MLDNPSQSNGYRVSHRSNIKRRAMADVRNMMNTTRPVMKIGVIYVTSSLYEAFSKSFVKRKRLLRTARYRARRAYADKVDSHSNKNNKGACFKQIHL